MKHRIVLFCMLVTTNAFAGDLTNSPGDPVAFFKQAISAPPDVEEFNVREYGFIGKASCRFTGARAGENYFLQAFSDTNGANALAAPRRLSAAGRSGATQYEFSQNAVSFAFGSNGFTAVLGVEFNTTRQILDMGLGEVEPESVKWDGDTFTASNFFGRFEYGELNVSNGLPSRLEISAAKGSPPYKEIDYTYPDPPSSFNGFPAKISILHESDGALIPEVEMQFDSVQLSAEPLPDNFFAAAQFVTPNILYTNIYSNSDVYAQLRRGHTVTMAKVPDSIMKSGE